MRANRGVLTLGSTENHVAVFNRHARGEYRMDSKGAARSSLGHRIQIVSRIYGPGLRRAIVTFLLLGVGLPMPCLGQRLATTPTFDAWSALEVRQLTDRPMSSFLPKRGTHKSLGLWVGFGLGVLAVPFVWSACERGSGICTASEKTFIVGALPIGGAFLGSLVGRQFKKKDRPLQNNTAADSASRVSTDSLVNHQRSLVPQN